MNVVAVHSEVGKYRRPLSGAVAYSNRMDRTTATLRLSIADVTQVSHAQRRAGNSKIIKSCGNFVCVEYRNINT